MSQPKINLILVSYLNTLPFIEGFKINASHGFNLVFKTPSEGAKSYFNQEAPLALIPVGSLIHQSNFTICTDYCIGCDGAVRTVGLFSDVSIDQIERIYLDADSRTSVLLVKVLMDNLGYSGIEWIPGLPEIASDIPAGSGVLAIGDKVFDYEGKWPYFYDLGALWKQTFDLPFAFAVFVAQPGLDPAIIAELNKILKDGINNISHMDFSGAHQIKDLAAYFQKNISYHMDDDKKKALNLFMAEVKRLEL